MYRCFKVSMKDTDFWGKDSKDIAEWKKQGELIRSELQSQVESIFDNVTSADGVIDGEKLSDIWFPIVKRDVFLSYSHNDKDLALTIAGVLKERFGLSVFMDELIWGSADDLLKAIDNEYCMQKDDTYNYKKRNFSTSHVHAMLTTSIIQAMDQAEALFFLNTSNSTYQLKDGFSKEHTLSPWIYEEIMFTTVLRPRTWSEHRTAMINESAQFQDDLNIAYPLKMSGFQTMNFKDFVEWEKQWENCKTNNIGRYEGIFLNINEKIHPLNVLYEMKFGKE